MISYNEVKLLLDELEPDYLARHNQFKKLRDFWHGRYWQDVDTSVHGLASIFRDMAGAQRDIGPDMKLVRNLVFDVCVKYQSYLSSLPMIRTFVDRPDSRRARAQAALKERVLYGTWDQANMNKSLNQIAWFGPLMGDCFHGIWPDFDNKSVKSIVRSPEHAFPVVNADSSGLDALIFKWKVPGGRVGRMFPNYTGGGSEGSNDKNVEITEYSDTKQFYRWVEGQQVTGVQHDLGFNLFEQIPFIEVPGETWNHGAVEQSVNLVEAGNTLYSLMMQAMFENVFPRLILEDPMKFSENLDFGPGAVIPVNAGGKAYFMAPPAVPLAQGEAILQENERAIKQGTSMPDVNFGQFHASIITGKAVNALQGAGTGSVVEMVQGGGIGTALEAWNEKAITIYQRMFRDDSINLQGVRPQSIVDLNPRQFAVSFKGKDLIGSPRNEVVFSPYIDMHGKLVMALQAQGAGLVSKAWSREQIGISDSEAMQEEVVQEVIDDAIIGAIVNHLQQDPSQDSGDAAMQQVTQYLDASGTPALGPSPTPHPLLASAPTAGGGAPVATMPGGGQMMAPALQMPPGAPLQPTGAPPPGAAPPAPATAPAGVSLQDALDAFKPVQLQGRAFLVGEIVAKGSTQDAVDVAVTNPADKQPLQDAATFPVAFHVVAAEPKEQFVEIGTGKQGGAPPSAAALLGG